MRIDPRSGFPPAIAVIVLLLVGQQTSSALKGSGAWQGARHGAGASSPDPYATLDAILSRPMAEYPAERARDPFGYAAPPAVVVSRPSGPVRPHRPIPVVPAPPSRPVLTSIIFDADPRATVRFNNRDFSVRENSLFADYRVRTITASQVILESRGGESLVLTLAPKGE